MASTLAARGQAAMAAWGLVPDGPAIPTDDAWLCPVRQGDMALMLKVVTPGGDEARQGEILAALNGQSSVRLWAQDGPVLLLERLRSGGMSLEEMVLIGQDDDALDILLELICHVQAGLRAAALPGLIALDARAGVIGQVAGDPATPPQIARALGWAAGLAAELLADTGGWQPLHGDLHHYNAIPDVGRGWCAIDPKGLLGPPEYDAAVALLNPYPHARLVQDPARMARQAMRAAERMGCDRPRMLSFMALHGFLGTAWSVADADGPYWLACAQVAARLAGLSPPEGR